MRVQVLHESTLTVHFDCVRNRVRTKEHSRMEIRQPEGIIIGTLSKSTGTVDGQRKARNSKTHAQGEKQQRWRLVTTWKRSFCCLEKP